MALSKRQIGDGQIDDIKIAAGAAIASSKLADGANFVKKDGTVSMTGNLNLGGQKVIGSGTATANDELINLGQLNSALGNLNSIFDAKPSAKAATTANINLANPGTAVFDGITLSNNDILFVRAQTTSFSNGLYKFNGSSSPLTRIPEMDAWAEIPGSFFAVEEGTTLADTIWLCTSNSGGTLGTTPITFQQIPTSAGLLNANFVDKEVPAGAIDGANLSFLLANSPITGSEHIYLNGLLQEAGASADYTISGTSIAFLVAPLSGEKIRVSYRK